MQDEHPIAALAEALDVSRSGGCAHRQKAAGVRRQEDQALTREIAPIFGASRRTYGCARVTAALRQSGRRCGNTRDMKATSVAVVVPAGSIIRRSCKNGELSPTLPGIHFLA